MKIPHRVFLNHSGVDTDAARKLKALMLASPEAQKAALTVWLDKDDLTAGAQWQRQIEEAIAGATAFVVYIGSLG